MTTRLLIADDNSLARSAIATAIAGEAGLEVVGEAADGYQALQQVRTLQPDMVLMDLNMPRCDGLLATRLIKRLAPHTIVVILTVSDDATDLFEAIRSGAQGYLLKSLAPQDWVAYLLSFAKGRWTMPGEMATRILGELQAPAVKPAASEGRLTDREVEILRLVARAMTNREIGESLRISEHTVKNHIKNILQKLHLKNRVDLALHARNVGSGV